MTAGMPIGYDNVKNQMTTEYCDKLIKREITDPTVTAQTKCVDSFLVEPLFDYLDDP
jgi:hypothetical protein